jgi:hypothetical protein
MPPSSGGPVWVPLPHPYLGRGDPMGCAFTSTLISLCTGTYSLGRGLGIAKAELVVDEVLEAVAGSLRREESVEIRGLGTFSIRHYRGYRVATLGPATWLK